MGDYIHGVEYSEVTNTVSAGCYCMGDYIHGVEYSEVKNTVSA